MRKKLITLTKKEHERLAIIRRIMKRELKQKEAGDLLELSTRFIFPSPANSSRRSSVSTGGGLRNRESGTVLAYRITVLN